MQNKRKLYISILILWVSLVPNIYGEQTLHIKFAALPSPSLITIDNNQELQGFEIDLANALCDKLKAKCTFNSEKTSSMNCPLTSQTYDAWIGSITVDKERSNKIIFSKPYLTTKALLAVAPKSTFNSTPAEMRNRTVGAKEHTCYVQYLKDHYGEVIKIIPFTTIDAGLEALQKGEIDAFIDDELPLKDWRKSQNPSEKYRLLDMPARYIKLIWQSYGIAVNKDNPELLVKINHVLNLIKSDGTLKTLIKKYNL